MAMNDMEDRYIIQCTCINENNDFGLKIGDVNYYNKKARTYKYLTKKWTQVHWNFNGTYMVPDGDPNNVNPYSGSSWDYSAPVTPKMNNAKIYKRLAETENVVRDIEKVGDFKCKILRLKTIVEELN